MSIEDVLIKENDSYEIRNIKREIVLKYSEYLKDWTEWPGIATTVTYVFSIMMGVIVSDINDSFVPILTVLATFFILSLVTIYHFVRHCRTNGAKLTIGMLTYIYVCWCKIMIARLGTVVKKYWAKIKDIEI